jgi:hypothetical protein
LEQTKEAQFVFLPAGVVRQEKLAGINIAGTYGMKPTYGLVPYSGIAGLDFTVDHAGLLNPLRNS